MNAEIRANMGARLAAERERLGLTQPAFAKLGDTKARTLQDWERGIAAPSSEFLAAVGRHGTDVLYVLTGRRVPVGAGTLSPEEMQLLGDYKTLDGETQSVARRVLAALASQGNPQPPAAQAKRR